MRNTYRASITDGFNGEEIIGANYPTWDNAIAFVHRSITKHTKNVNEIWRFVTLEHNAETNSTATVIDVGSHQVFARIVETINYNEE